MRNTEANIKKLGLSKHARAIESDVFDQIPENETFDIIYWNYPWLPESEEYAYQDEVERGLFDHDYKYLKKYLHDARKFLKPNGRIFLGFGDFGDMAYLAQLGRFALRFWNFRRGSA